MGGQEFSWNLALKSKSQVRNHAKTESVILVATMSHSVRGQRNENESQVKNLLENWLELLKENSKDEGWKP